MPIHNWERVIAGTFHDFHQGWVVQLRSTLNDGLLPPDYYAQVEQGVEQRPGRPEQVALVLGLELAPGQVGHQCAVIPDFLNR